MNNQIIIVYQFNAFYKIIKEMEEYLNFNVIEILDEKVLKNKIKEMENYIIVSNKKTLDDLSQITFEKFPMKIFKIIEKLNIEFLKARFSGQSQIFVKNYMINLNSREINFKNKKLKLTEKEVQTIIYLSKASKPVTSLELQNDVWRYQQDLETHTVETHIYRLRKKFLNFFNDNKFIISEKNGYKI